MIKSVKSFKVLLVWVCIASLAVIVLLELYPNHSFKFQSKSNEPVKLEPPLPAPIPERYQGYGSIEKLSSTVNPMYLDWRAKSRDAAINTLRKRSNYSEDQYKLITGLDALKGVPQSYGCENNGFFRIGRGGDGGKWYCGDFSSKLLKSETPCVVFSLGSNGDFSFEADFYQKFEGRCQVHTFDCTGDFQPPENIHFHKWCLSSHDHVNDGFIFKSWSSILKELNVARVEYLKMDIEGYEWSTLPFVFQEPLERLPSQIAFELHATPVFYPKNDVIPREMDAVVYENNYFLPVNNFFLKAYEVGYEVASVESNIPSPVPCTEYLLVLPKSIGLNY